MAGATLPKCCRWGRYCDLGTVRSDATNPRWPRPLTRVFLGCRSREELIRSLDEGASKERDRKAWLFQELIGLHNPQARRRDLFPHPQTSSWRRRSQCSFRMAGRDYWIWNAVASMPLDETGTQLLALTLQFGPNEAARRIAQEYGISHERVLADCNKLFGNLRRKRLLVSPIKQLAKRRSPNRLTIWLLLTAAWLCLRLLGWAGTLRLWRRGRSSTTVSPEGHVEAAVRDLDQSIRAAAALHPLNTQCKERALVAWHILRNR